MYSRTDKSVAVGMLAFACAVLAVAAWLKPAQNRLSSRVKTLIG